jgi:succinate dehydrogenase flavoprotein subunit
VPFNRTPEGRLDRRKFGGSLFARTHFAGASTGQQLLYALDEQVRRYEADGKVNKYEFWEFLWPVIDPDDGVCKGIIAQDMRTMQIKPFHAEAVIMATGGCGVVFGKSTMSVICTGGAASRCYQAGAWLGNPEFIQVHPTAIPGEDKCRLMSESARGEGGRIWVPAVKGADGHWKPHPKPDQHPLQVPNHERWYFLEEKYPKFGNLVSRDIATRELFFVCRDGFGVGGGNMVYLDVSHLPPDTKHKLKAILEIYEKFTGEDPTEVPMKIFPAVHYSMGGLYTVYEAKEDNRGMVPGAPDNMMTNITGLYAFGEVNYQYHGATRLGANALLNCIFDGIFCGQSVVSYVRSDSTPAAGDAPDAPFTDAAAAEQKKVQRLIDSDGDANPYDIHRRLGVELTDSCTVVRTEDRMRQAYAALKNLKEEYKRVRLSDTGMWTNQNLSFTRALGDMLIYAEAILLASIERKESRGSHYRPDYPDRNDKDWLKTTIAKYNPADGTHTLNYEPVPTPLVPPRVRSYGKVEGDGDEKASAKTKKKAKAAAR